jgi:segregation and condensation protein B
MILKTIEKIFRNVSGFIRNSIINRLRRGKVDLEDQQAKSAEDVGQKSMDKAHMAVDESPVPTPVVIQQEYRSEDQPLPIRHNQEKPAEEPVPEDNRPQSQIDQNASDAARQPEHAVNLQDEQSETDAASSTQDRQLKSAIESLLFVAANPLSLERLQGVFEDALEGQIQEQLKALMQEYETRGSGIMLVEVAGGHQLVTKPENAVWIRKFRSVKISSKLSRPALETLAIIAYKQPITRTEVEVIRGVNIGGIVRNLMERRLVKIVGKKDVPGKPMLYGTTPEFLQYFGLKDLSSLPTLKEFQELEAGEEVMEETPVESADAVPSVEAPAAEAGETDPVGAAVTRENATR